MIAATNSQVSSNCPRFPIRVGWERLKMYLGSDRTADPSIGR